MSGIKIPRSLRTADVAGAGRVETDGFGKRDAQGTAALACLMALGAISPAKAQQQQNLPPVTIDPPVVRKRTPVTRPSPEQIRARDAIRRAARRNQPVTPTAEAQTPAPNSDAGTLSRDPYANPAAPYRADRVSSTKITEPLANTPRTVTVLTKEVLEDKGATSLKEALRTTPGLTLGTGEGGNAFGDRFFIRGFDARNDVFIDGVRDPGVSIRENFFTEQIEILKGPGSSFAGRGIAGGALNIVTKQAADRNFTNWDSTFGTDGTKRVTLDVNQVIHPTLSIRANGMWQAANIAGRNYVFDDRWGGLLAVKWQPSDTFKLTANYVHVDMNSLPDFGVPYYRPSTASTAGGPFPEFGVSRNNWYGFVNRDFQKAQQDFATLNMEYFVNDWVTLNNRTRVGRSVLDYVGTLPEAPVITNPNPLLWTLSANPQSRYSRTDVVANQTDLTAKFMTGPIFNTAVAGVEVSREKFMRDTYTGLTSEALPGGFSGTGALTGVSVFYPQNNNIPFGTKPVRANSPTNIPIDTTSGYVLNTANYQDLILVNAGARFDDYNVTASNALGSNSVHSGMFNYNGGVVVKPVSYVSLYGAYATSSNPVGAEVDGTSVQYGGLAPFLPGNSNQVLGPERNRSAEVGVKVELLDRRLLGTVALFETDKDNARESRNVVMNGTTVSLITAGAAYRVRGVEFGLTGKLTELWSVFAGAVFLDSEVTKSLIPPANTFLYSSNVGLPLANIAHQSFNILTKYRVHDNVEIGGQATYMSKIYGGTFLAANQGTSIPDHWRFDAFVEARLGSNWIAKLAVYNLTNELYYDALYQSAAPFVLVAPGRSGTLTVSARF